VFFSFTLTPELPQSLYWRSGMLPYLAPLIAQTFLAGLVISQTLAGRSSSRPLAGIFLLAFFAGGFSETATAVQLSALAGVLFALVVARRIGIQLPAQSLGPAWIAFAGTLLAASLLALSPSNQFRLATLEQTANVLRLLSMSISNAYLFLHALPFRYLLPISTLFLLSTAISWQAFTESARTERFISWRGLSVAAVSLTLLWAAFIVAVMLPSAYAQSSYPVGRALIIAAFTSSSAITGLGVIVGAFAARFTPGGRTPRTVAVALAIGVMVVLPISASSAAWSELPRYTRWARFWDDRDREIRQAREKGTLEIDVMLLDRIVADVAALQPDPDYWYNNCAEWYYDLRRLSASLPGWDDPG
jgi:hypothetical protein